MSNKGLFRPKNAVKYRGDHTQIVYRSLWELKLMMYLDDHPDVIQWASEELTIPYKSPIDGRTHRYYPDFWVKQKNKSGIVEVIIIEVKPKKQTAPPATSAKKTKRYIQEVVTWGVNSAKWEAAEKYCADRNWKFMLMTEKELGIKF